MTTNLDLLREEVLTDWSYAHELDYAELGGCAKDYIRSLPDNRDRPEAWLTAHPDGEYWAYESLNTNGRQRVDAEVARRLGERP